MKARTDNKDKFSKVKHIFYKIIIAMVIYFSNVKGMIGGCLLRIQNDRELEESVITLVRMALTSLLGVIRGYFGSLK